MARSHASALLPLPWTPVYLPRTNDARPMVYRQVVTTGLCTIVGYWQLELPITWREIVTRFAIIRATRAPSPRSPVCVAPSLVHGGGF